MNKFNRFFLLSRALHFSKPLLQVQVAKFAVDKLLLKELRKKTGYSFAKCSEALRKFKNEAGEAETWLHKQAESEGWSKAQKLSGRTAKQGLVGVVQQNNFAALVHMGCETDFVSKNELFQDLVSVAAKCAMNFRRSVVEQNLSRASGGAPVVHLREEVIRHHMQGLPVEGSPLMLEEYMVSVVGRIGENIVIQRAISMSTEISNVIGCAVHGNTTNQLNDCLLGNFASIVTLRPLTETVDHPKISRLATGLAQHVIGMNPKAVAPSEHISEEDALLTQEYMLNDKLKISQLLHENQVEVVDYIRYSVNDN